MNILDHIKDYPQLIKYIKSGGLYKQITEAAFQAGYETAVKLMPVAKKEVKK